MLQRLRVKKHSLGALLAVFLVSALLLSCERKQPPTKRKDTARSIVQAPESTVGEKPQSSPWDSSAGPALFVAGATPQEALIIAPQYTDAASLDSMSPDVSAFDSLRIETFGGGKRTGTARIVSIKRSSRTDSCRTWPTAHLDAAGETGPTLPWSVGFESGRALEVSIDSIEVMPTADSARLAADVARLASALPGDTTPAFRGLPFVVNKAWRTRLPNGQMLLVAIAIRNVNQEANPRQERIFLIAERDSLSSGSQFTSRYSERIAGREETLETTEPLALVLLGVEREPTVVISRDTGNGVSYALIERVRGRWQERWASTYAGC